MKASPSRERLVLYVTSGCPRCARARALLAAAGLRWEEVAIDTDRAALRAFARVARGRRTVPQLARDGQLVGDLETLERLARSGRLARLCSRSDQRPTGC